MKIKFLGAAGTVTGSSYLLTSDAGQTILIDLGMFQGEYELEKLNYILPEVNYSALTAVLLTHAHLDHCGRLPLLTKNGFNKDIWMTAPTRDLTEISLQDTAKIMEEERKKMPLYETRDVENTLNLIKTVEYDKTLTIGDFEVVLRDDGHILGSASIEITANGKSIVFSGDLGNSPQPLIRETETVSQADFAVIESTYGDKDHTDENATDMIGTEINLIEASSGTLLIPAFSIERSQEILHIISHLKSINKINKDTLVFFDSPMAEKVTDVFEKYRSFYNQELTDDFSKSDPFHFEGLIYVKKGKESENIINQSGAKVIIAGSGMMTGGRIVHHAINYLPLLTTCILFVGYQAEGTLGRKILEGQKTITIEGQNVEVKAKVSEIQSLSSHADQSKLLKWLGNIKGVKEVFITHGDDNQRKLLSEKIRTDLKINDVRLPLINQEFDLP